MREFVILIGELIVVTALQRLLEIIFKEWNMEKQITVVSIACVIISYFLLLRFVYNNFLEELTAFVNFTF